LNAQEFATLREPCVVVATWRIAHNAYRPHSSLAPLTPVEFMRQWLTITKPHAS
jgi:transposase InsO family protein